MQLVLSSETAAQRTVVHAQGEVTIDAAGKLRDYLLGLIRTGHCDLVVDLDGVEVVDPAGVNVLRSVAKRVRVLDGSLHVVCPREMVPRVFMGAPPPEFPVHRTVAEVVGPSARRRRRPAATVVPGGDAGVAPAASG